MPASIPESSAAGPESLAALVRHAWFARAWASASGAPAPRAASNAASHAAAACRAVSLELSITSDWITAQSTDQGSTAFELMSVLEHQF